MIWHAILMIFGWIILWFGFWEASIVFAEQSGVDLWIAVSMSFIVWLVICCVSIEVFRLIWLTEKIHSAEKQKEIYYFYDDRMGDLNEYEFAYFCVERLKKDGFCPVGLAKESDDQGVDNLANKDG